MIEYHHGHHIVTLLRPLHLMWNLFEIVIGTGDLYKIMTIKSVCMKPTTMGSCSSACSIPSWSKGFD